MPHLLRAQSSKARSSKIGPAYWEFRLTYQGHDRLMISVNLCQMLIEAPQATVDNRSVSNLIPIRAILLSHKRPNVMETNGNYPARRVMKKLGRRNALSMPHAPASGECLLYYPELGSPRPFLLDGLFVVLQKGIANPFIEFAVGSSKPCFL